MAQFLTTNAISYQIEQVITTARHQLILISPFLQLSPTLRQRLRDASEREIKIHVVYGKSELRPDEYEAFSKLKGLRLYYLENLHAKCYANEDVMIIGSMNMYEYSEKNNREMGVLLTRVGDSEAFEAAAVEIRSIVRAAVEQRRPTRTKEAGDLIRRALETVSRSSRLSIGMCIRCGTDIRLNPDRPLCGECYRIWAQWQDYGYPENFCHACGKETDTSMAKPLCYPCFIKQTQYVPSM